MRCRGLGEHKAYVKTISYMNILPNPDYLPPLLVVI